MTDVARLTWKDPAWFVTFTGWATDELATLGFEVTGEPQQTHVRPWSTVVRIPTDRGPFWAKAMRPSTSHEARLLPAMGGIGKAAAWARALDGLDTSEMEGHGDAPALWLTDFAELLDAGVDR
jgi:hypothetical protein